MTCRILIAYYSREGSTAKMARLIARGVEKTQAEAVVRQVASLNGNGMDDGPPILSTEDWAECDGLIMGSPTRFGNMAAPLKHAIDQTGSHWASGTLVDKPAAVFASSGSMHGGQESTLLSMMLPLMHHGMLIAGLPYSEAGLMRTTSGGTPYGASHWAGPDNDRDLDENEAALCRALGQRVARLALGRAR